MSADFGKLLNVQVDSVERPKPFPVGSYDALVMGHEAKESAQKETPFIRFQVKLMAPREDVDAEEFENAGGMEKLTARNAMRYDFYLTPDAYYRLREFLENGLGLQCAGRTFDAVLPETDNVPFIASIKHVTGREEGEVYMEISGHALAD